MTTKEQDARNAIKKNYIESRKAELKTELKNLRALYENTYLALQHDPEYREEDKYNLMQEAEKYRYLVNEKEEEIKMISHPNYDPESSASFQTYLDIIKYTKYKDDTIDNEYFNKPESDGLLYKEPSEEEMERAMKKYENTPYDPSSKLWDSEFGGGRRSKRKSSKRKSSKRRKTAKRKSSKKSRK
jgi:hypothetical protein